jgi:hypothetical protein
MKVGVSCTIQKQNIRVKLGRVQRNWKMRWVKTMLTASVMLKVSFIMNLCQKRLQTVNFIKR